MKKVFQCLAILAFLPWSWLNAQTADTTYWQRSFSGAINFNQASFSNWAGGGVNSTAFGTIILGRALYKKDKTSWDNTMDVQLGFQKQQGVPDWRKASDQILLNSVAGYKISSKWDLCFSGTFTSFLAAGYKYGGAYNPVGTSFKVAEFFSPAQLTLGWGVAYKPNDWFALRLSPFAPRFTFLANDELRFREDNGVLIRDKNAKTYGVEAGKSTYAEWLALQVQATVNRNITKNISLKAEYFGFLNYQKPLNEIDHRLNLLVAATITKYISATFGLTMLYDKDLNENLQIQQNIGVGFLYSASTFK